MFTQRLNTIMQALELSPPALAKTMGCDRSNIDRICKGSRVPRRDGKSALRIADALYVCADDAGRTDVLLQTVPCEDATSGEKIRAAILRWLFAEEKENQAGREAAGKRQTNRVFGQRLNAVMELTGLSNNRLGKLLHVDASYVSRFRNGSRSPAANPRMSDKICEILLSLVKEQALMPRLAGLMRVPEAALTPDEAALSLF